MENQHEAKDPFFTTANSPFEQTHHTSKVQPPPPPDDTTNDVSHQVVNDFLQRMQAIVADNLARVGADPLTIYNNTNNNDKPSTMMPTSQAKKTSLRGKARQSSSVNISKADFMLVSSNTASSIHNSTSAKNGSDSSFVKHIARTSTPINKKNSKQQLASQKNVVSTKQQPLGNSKRRSTTVLEEVVNKNAADIGSGTSSHRYSMRTRTSASGIRKTSTTLNKKPVKSRTFNFGSSKKR